MNFGHLRGVFKKTGLSGTSPPGDNVSSLIISITLQIIALAGFRIWRQYWGYIFFGVIFPSKMGHFAPFLATIQRLSKTCVFLSNKRSEVCFVWATPSLVPARTIS
jgi:hypothetical protein